MKYWPCPAVSCDSGLIISVCMLFLGVGTPTDGIADEILADVIPDSFPHKVHLLRTMFWGDLIDD